MNKLEEEEEKKIEPSTAILINTSDPKDKSASDPEESYEIIQMSDEEKKDEATNDDAFVNID